MAAVTEKAGEEGGEMKKMMSGSGFESYPPALRPTHESVESDEHGEEVEGPDTVPVIDAERLDPGKLGEACREWGVFRLVNHGMGSTLLSEIRERAKEVFGLPFETKRALFAATNPLSYFWGTAALAPSGSALSRGNHDADRVEGFNVPLGQLSQFRAGDPLIDSFRDMLEEYGRHQARLARTIFEALAKNLKLDPKQLDSHYMAESTGIIRVYRYPARSSGTRALGLEEHTDSSVLSILNQDDVVGGLQFLKDNEWLHVKPVPDTLVVNIGDMMQAMSDDEYRSVKHRVVGNKQRERISICYFVFPADEGTIRSSRYIPFSYTDFRAQVQKDIRQLGSKIGLQRFKLPTAVD
ncbi:gibberellin 2-beta-dioxygenase 6 [Malania oleifera]|uniref:gibberellin 2-beta-dioxygenase 6 n=1 Tax=Malania oleifera TaxID=397392 RepID=UPI0025AEC5AF|nr:gibberellin 2-beta-dioxygenase 6 [Malania oleifera]